MRQFILLSVCFLFALGAHANTDETHLRGWLEHARVMPSNLLMTAKLDSGARTTSIHAEILTQTEQPAENDASEGSNGSDEMEGETLSAAETSATMPDDPPADEVENITDGVVSEFMPEKIRFRLTSKGGRKVILTRPVERWVSIRRRGGGSIVRPVVKLDLCIAGRRVSGEVNLADRSNFNYPLLIGRNMLTDAAIGIDSRQIFASKRACPPEA